MLQEKRRGRGQKGALRWGNGGSGLHLEHVGQALSGCLELSLIHLKNVLYQPLWEVEANHIGPLERLARLDQLRGCLLHKLDVDVRLVAFFLHLIHLQERHLPELALKLARLEVIGEALKVVHVPLQRRPAARDVAVVGRKLVAAVLIRCVLKRTQANPAKVVVALFAVDVIAAAILINGDTAFGAVLCVCLQPVACLRVVPAFLPPLPHIFTVGWHVRLLPAVEAPFMAFALLLAARDYRFE